MFKMGLRRRRRKDFAYDDKEERLTLIMSQHMKGLSMLLLRLNVFPRDFLASRVVVDAMAHNSCRLTRLVNKLSH